MRRAFTRLLNRLTGRARIRQLTAELANLEHENDLLFEANSGLTEKLRLLMVPLGGGERAEGKRWVN